MPSFPIVDAHAHLWDPHRLSYKWLRGNELLDRPYLTEDYSRASGQIDVAAMVFVESAVDAGLAEQEIRLVEAETSRDARIRGIVAQASLEQGAAALPFLEHLKATTPLLRGVRRIVESEPDPGFCLQPDFIEGVKGAAQLGLSVEITVNYRHMDALLQFVERVGDVSLMLDHCGKPGIREGRLEPWASQLRSLAATRPDMRCKLSGLLTEAAHRGWTEQQVRPYIDVAVEAFGFKRLLFGSDWPVCLQAAALTEWVALLDRALAGVSTNDLRCFWRDNAIAFYRLDLAGLTSC
jgi:L-fuconolactonase